MITEPSFFQSRTPVLHDVRDITVVQTARNGLVALISYEHQVLYVALLSNIHMIEYNRHLLNFGN